MPRTAKPSLDQLLHLVDRAADRRLLPEEAALLRAAIRSGVEASRSAGGLQGQVQKLRNEVVDLRRQIAGGSIARPLDVSCPHCGASVHNRCRGPVGPLQLPHGVRVRAAKEAAT